MAAPPDPGVLRSAPRRPRDRLAPGRVIVQSRGGGAAPPTERRSAPPRRRSIPPGYTPLPDPTPGDRPFARSLGLSGPFALFAGRLASNKGFRPCSPAFATLHRHDPTASLVLVGEDGGQGRRGSIRWPQLGIARRVHVVGFVADEARLAAGVPGGASLRPAERVRGVRPRPPRGARAGNSRHRLAGRRHPGVHRGRQGGLAGPSRRGCRASARRLLALWDDPELRRRGWGEYGRTEVVPRHSWEKVVDRLERHLTGTTQSMNVAEVTLRFDAPGGVETTVQELARTIPSLGD